MAQDRYQKTIAELRVALSPQGDESLLAAAERLVDESLQHRREAVELKKELQLLREHHDALYAYLEAYSDMLTLEVGKLGEALDSMRLVREKWL